MRPASRLLQTAARRYATTAAMPKYVKRITVSFRPHLTSLTDVGNRLHVVVVGARVLYPAPTGTLVPSKASQPLWRPRWGLGLSNSEHFHGFGS